MASVSVSTAPGQSTQTQEDANDSTGLDDTWTEYNFNWLFDPDRFDHLPIEEQLKLYQQRDLKKTKRYKFAARIFGAPQSRRRVITAQPLHTSWSKDHDFPVRADAAQAMQSPLKPQRPPPVLPTAEQVKADEEKKKLEEYYNWINDRKTFRKNLDSMGLQEEWLARKPDKTALEQRVLTRMIEKRTQQSPPLTPPETLPLNGVLPDESPMVRRPSPQAVRIIEKFLHRKKMRLIDLFRTADKNKDWKVTRQEFRNTITQARIPISEVLLEDLILALDVDLNDKLDYREMAKGMGLWKMEKRDTKRNLLGSEEFSKSPTMYAQLSGFASPERAIDAPVLATQKTNSSLVGKKSKSGDRAGDSAGSKKLARTRIDSPGAMGGNGEPRRDLLREESSSSLPRLKSAISTMSSGTTGSSQYLGVPGPDTRDEAFILSSDEAMVDNRKRDRGALNRMTRKNVGKGSGKRGKRAPSSREVKTMIKTGDPAIDNHMLPSTLGGETGELVDKFRQLKLKEYNEICQLCQQNDVPFTEEVLRKVLLFFPDKPHSQIRKHLRQPTQGLVSRASSDPRAKRAKSPSPENSTATRSKSKAKRSGEALVDSRHAYPSSAAVSSSPTKANLSTGRALVGTKVNCWMTFEEYDRLTSSPFGTVRNNSAHQQSTTPNSSSHVRGILRSQGKPQRLSPISSDARSKSH